MPLNNRFDDMLQPTPSLPSPPPSCKLLAIPSGVKCLFEVYSFFLYSIFPRATLIDPRSVIDPGPLSLDSATPYVTNWNSRENRGRTSTKAPVISCHIVIIQPFIQKSFRTVASCSYYSQWALFVNTLDTGTIGFTFQFYELCFCRCYFLLRSLDF